jgi:hypothetical protein
VTSLMSQIQSLTKRARPLITDALKSEEEAEEKAKAAGELLLKIKDMRKRMRNGRDPWSVFVEKEFGISQQWADRMIRIHKGMTTVKTDREKNKERVARHRDKVIAKAVQRSEAQTVKTELAPASAAPDAVSAIPQNQNYNFDSSSPAAPPRLPGELGHIPPETPRDQLLRLCDEVTEACASFATNVPVANWGGLHETVRKAADALNALADKLKDPIQSARLN